MVDVTLLGCGGMMPLPHRYLTALLYRYQGRLLLVDCGEGTQASASRLWRPYALHTVTPTTRPACPGCC